MNLLNNLRKQQKPRSDVSRELHSQHIKHLHHLALLEEGLIVNLQITLNPLQCCPAALLCTSLQSEAHALNIQQNRETCEMKQQR